MWSGGITYSVIGIIICSVMAAEEGENLSSEDLEFLVEGQQNEDSCKWIDPPTDGYSYRLCNSGICAGEKGSYSKNGTRRFTKCRKDFVLVQGYDTDTCINGVWSSSGHNCLQCGQSPKVFDPKQTVSLIHAGHNSSRGDFPWMAALYTVLEEGKWKHICGGTLISPYIVLTAAHCFEIDGRRFTPQEMKVGLGKLFENYYANEPNSVIASAKELVRPERYIGYNRQFDLDIGLIVLTKSVGTNARIMPACLDWSAAVKPKNNEIGVLAGWGLTESLTKSAILKWTYQNYLDYESCRSKILPQDHRFLTHDKFCTGEMEGQADKGDSGGGLTFVREGTHFVYGIISTKPLTGGKQVRLFTNLMNDGHRAWLLRQWRRLQVQHGNLECEHDEACIGEKVCESGKCQDPCSVVCGPNSSCKMVNHIVSCTCKPSFIGDAIEGCRPVPGTDACSESRDCAPDEACVDAQCANPCTGACGDNFDCQVREHIPVCSQRLRTLELYTRNENFRNTFIPSKGSSIINFKVQASNDAHIMLSENSISLGAPYYEIVIGGLGNMKSVIRRDTHKEALVEKNTPEALSEDEFRGFWIKFLDGTIRVGKEKEEAPFMEWTDPTPVKVNHVGFATGFGSTGDWIVQGAGCDNNQECSEDRVCVSGLCVESCLEVCRDEHFCEVHEHVAACSQPGQYKRVNTKNTKFDYTFYPARNSSYIRFKVKAKNDAYVMMSEYANPTDSQHYYEIFIGGSGNKISGIRKDRHEGQDVSTYTPDFVTGNELRGFWITYVNGNIALGREFETTPFLTWTDPSPINFKFIGVSTGFGSTGKWFLYGI